MFGVIRDSSAINIIYVFSVHALLLLLVAPILACYHYSALLIFSSQNVSIYDQNARGLRTKSHNFLNNILNSIYDIVCITET